MSEGQSAFCGRRLHEKWKSRLPHAAISVAPLFRLSYNWWKRIEGVGSPLLATLNYPLTPSFPLSFLYCYSAEPIIFLLFVQSKISTHWIACRNGVAVTEGKTMPEHILSSHHFAIFCVRVYVCVTLFVRRAWVCFTQVLRTPKWSNNFLRAERNLLNPFKAVTQCLDTVKFGSHARRKCRCLFFNNVLMHVSTRGGCL